ncbi:MAG: carboxypeptidase-like regulatory domain-containing protein [Bacteroidota bacterium]
MVFFIISVLPAAITAQIKLEGYLKDKEDDSAISFATVGVYSKGIGTISNADGSFLLLLDEQCKSEVLKISALGYQPVEVAVASLLDERVTLYLEESVRRLDEVIIKKSEVKKASIRKYEYGNTYVNTGTMRLDGSRNGGGMALLMSHENLPYKIDEAKIKIKHNTLPSFRVRVRLLEVDTLTGMPGADLLDESVVLQSTIRKGWLTFDLRPFHLWMKKQSFYVMFEWVLDAKDRQLLTDRLLDHLTNNPESVTTNTLMVQNAKVEEKTIKNFKDGVWFATVISPLFRDKFISYYRLNNLDSWKPSAAIPATTITVSGFRP